MAEYFAMCSTAEELLHLRTVLEHFGFRVNTTLYCDSVPARGIAQRAGLEEVKALAVKNVMVARGSRERAADQVDCFEGKQGQLRNESVAGGEAEHVAESTWYCGTWRIVETYS